MDNSDKTFEYEKRSKFKEILFDLAADAEVKDAQSIYDKYHLRFEKLYEPDVNGNEFRHFYSDIFVVLTQIELKDKPGNIDTLGERIGLLRQAWNDVDSESNVSKNIKKLYDHVSLDIARMTWSDRGDRELSGIDSIRERNEDISKLHKEVEEIEHRTDKLKKDINDYQKENITILGIFASIVLAFTGGMTFSSSVLENLDKASIYRIILVISFLGFIVFNILWMLIHFLRDINEKNGYNKLYMIAINVLLILSMAFTFVAYKCHWLERESADLANNQKIEVKIESEI